MINSNKANKQIQDEVADPATQASDQNIAEARKFLEIKWAERAQELGRDKPRDLSGACKFASLFAQKLFGGTIQGNYDHQYNVLPDKRKLDLTNSPLPLIHDPSFFGNEEHEKSMHDCLYRVDQWLNEYLDQ